MSQNETAAPEAPTRVDALPATKSVEAWKRKAIHEGVTLPSGAVVAIKLPSLEQLVKNGTIPNPLIQAALKHKDAKELTEEILSETWEYARFIVPLCLVEPEISADDVEELPKEDVDLICQFAGRQKDTDAVGHQLGGLETVTSFRNHRGIIDLSEALGDVS